MNNTYDTYYFYNSTLKETAGFMAANSDEALAVCVKETGWLMGQIIYIGKGLKALEEFRHPTPEGPGQAFKCLQLGAPAAILDHADALIG